MTVFKSLKWYCIQGALRILHYLKYLCSILQETVKSNRKHVKKKTMHEHIFNENLALLFPFTTGLQVYFKHSCLPGQQIVVVAGAEAVAKCSFSIDTDDTQCLLSGGSHSEILEFVSFVFSS